MKYFEKTINSKRIFEGKVVKLRIDKVLLNNGAESMREVVEHSGAVAVLPLQDNGNIFLVKQFRKPIENELIELPAGKLENGENPEECAKRELEEEIGYKAGKLVKLISIYTSPGFADEIIHIYVATDLIKTKINRDEDEFMDIMDVNFKEAQKMIFDGQITDAKTIAGILAFLQNKNNII